MAKWKLVLVLKKRVVKRKIWPLRFYKFIPTKEETEEARQKIREKIKNQSMLISRSEIARRFSVGKIRKDTKITIQEDEYTFLGANPKKNFPEMLLFLDKKKRFVRFTRSLQREAI